jgi:uncharacterized protein YdaU (DUF1376 family)
VAKEKEPFLPLFFGDFLASTAYWRGEEQGLYLLLLGYQWSSGPLPMNTEDIATVARYDHKHFLKLWARVGTKFVRTSSGLLNERLEEVRARSRDISRKRAEVGKRGGDSKWQSSDGATARTRSERLAAARRIATHSKEEWLALVAVCGSRCARCSKHTDELEGGVLCKDHIVPVYQGGSDGIDNIQPMCRNCNSSKGPDATDHRPLDWQQRLTERLAKCQVNGSQNASLTPDELPGSIPNQIRRKSKRLATEKNEETEPLQ